MQSGLAPKARRAFAIFVAERGTAKKGDPKEAHSVELKRLGKLWKQLPDEEKATYKERSSAEFAAQRAALVRHGTLPRMPKSPKKAGSSEKAGDSQEVVAIGPYKVAKQDVCSRNPVLGQGSYGKVLAATCPHGRRCAVKFFSGRDAKEELARELGYYQSMSKLEPAERSWYPLLLDNQVNALPWPWMALSLGSPSLDRCLRDSGPLPTSAALVLGAQLQRALQVLHRQCKLLHLDVKPANTLWCPHNHILQLCDFGMAEPAPQSLARPTPRFLVYVTKLYRPPELWTIREGDGKLLQKALTPAVDIWSFGCVLFEAAAGRPLMVPSEKLRTNCGHCVADWSQAYPQLALRLGRSGSAGHVQRASGIVATFEARLSLVVPVRAAVLAALHPDADQRSWFSFQASP